MDDNATFLESLRPNEFDFHGFDNVRRVTTALGGRKNLKMAESKKLLIDIYKTTR